MQEGKVRVGWFGNKVDIDAYLIEARSLGGLSGSPVFVYIDHVFRKQPDGGMQRVFKPEPRLYFLRLVHGHYDNKYERVEDSGITTESINFGIAIVVPVFKVIEVL